MNANNCMQFPQNSFASIVSLSDTICGSKEYTFYPEILQAMEEKVLTDIKNKPLSMSWDKSFQWLKDVEKVILKRVASTSHLKTSTFLSQEGSLKEMLCMKVRDHTENIVKLESLGKPEQKTADVAFSEVQCGLIPGNMINSSLDMPNIWFGTRRFNICSTISNKCFTICFLKCSKRCMYHTASHVEAILKNSLNIMECSVTMEYDGGILWAFKMAPFIQCTSFCDV